MDLTYSNIYLSNRNKTIYQHPNYLRMIEDVIGVKSQHLTCKVHSSAIPLFYKTTSYGKVYNSLPFFGSCGGIVGGNVFCTELEAQVSSIHQEVNFASINIISNWHNQVDLNESTISFNTVERKNSFKDLEVVSGDENTALFSYHSKTRNIVRATLANKFKLYDMSNEFENVTKIHFSEMIGRERVGKPIGFWEYLMKNKSSKLDYVIYGAKKDGETLGFILFVFDEKLGQIEYFVPGSTITGRRYNVNYFLIHSAIIEFSKQRFTTLHFGGSHLNQDNLIRFKERWGCKSYRYKYFNTYSKHLDNLSESMLTGEAPYFYIKPFTQ